MNLREGDFGKLRALHGKEGASSVIRRFVMDHLDRIDNRINQPETPQETEEP
jgi:hypothetical protein